MTDLNRETPCLDYGSASRDLTIIEHAGEAAHTTSPVPSAGHNDPRRLRTLVFDAAEMLSAPRAPWAIVSIEPPDRSPDGPWLGVLATGPGLFGMPESDGHALLAEMAVGLVAACPGVRALSPVEDLALLVVTLGTETGRLASFVPLVVTDRAAIAALATDLRPGAARPAPVHRAPVG